MLRMASVGCAALFAAVALASTPSAAGGDIYYEGPAYYVPPPLPPVPPVLAPVGYPYVPAPVLVAPPPVYYPAPRVYARPVYPYPAYRPSAYYGGYYGAPYPYVSSGYYGPRRYVRARAWRW